MILISEARGGGNEPFLIEKGTGKLSDGVRSQKVDEIFAFIVVEVSGGNIMT